MIAKHATVCNRLLPWKQVRVTPKDVMSLNCTKTYHSTTHQGCCEFKVCFLDWVGCCNTRLHYDNMDPEIQLNCRNINSISIQWMSTCSSWFPSEVECVILQPKAQFLYLKVILTNAGHQQFFHQVLFIVWLIMCVTCNGTHLHCILFNNRLHVYLKFSKISTIWKYLQHLPTIYAIRIRFSWNYSRLGSTRQRNWFWPGIMPHTQYNVIFLATRNLVCR